MLVALLSLFLAAPARAQFEAWAALGEEALHTTAFSTYAGRPKDIYSSCDATGRLSLPKAYLLDYKLTERDLDALARSLGAARRFADIRAALKAGYLPVAQVFTSGAGLMLAKPELLRDGTYDLDQPDILTFVKRRGKNEYRLVGLIYVAGAKEPVVPNVDFGDASRRSNAPDPAKTSTWDYDDQVCLVTRPGSVSLYKGGDVPFHCRDGTFFIRLFRLSVWTAVFNPQGLFSPGNTVVDWMDHSQSFGPLCPRPGDSRK